MLKWLLGIKKPKKFPTKTGVNALSCVGLLDLHGSLFCLDNQNILFCDNGKPKVIKPVLVVPVDHKKTEKLSDFDAVDHGDAFSIRYKGQDYYYDARFESTKVRGNTYIKLLDIKQPVYDTCVSNDCILTLDGKTV